MKRNAISILMLLAFISNPLLCYADEIKLYRSGERVRFSEDTHCMSNTVALQFLGKLRLCEEGCKIKLDGLTREYDARISGLEARLLNQRTMHQSILEEKDQTINKVQLEALTAVSDIESSQWWKITIGVLGGVAVGAATSALIMHYTR